MARASLSVSSHSAQPYLCEELWRVLGQGELPNNRRSGCVIIDPSRALAPLSDAPAQSITKPSNPIDARSDQLWDQSGATL